MWLDRVLLSVAVRLCASETCQPRRDVGCLSLCPGASCLNRVTCWRERTSAIWVVTPGRCFRNMLKLFFAAMKNRVWQSFVSNVFFGDFACQAWTIWLGYHSGLESSSSAIGAPRSLLLLRLRTAPSIPAAGWNTFQISMLCCSMRLCTAEDLKPAPSLLEA